MFYPRVTLQVSLSTKYFSTRCDCALFVFVTGFVFIQPCLVWICSWFFKTFPNWLQKTRSPDFKKWSWDFMGYQHFRKSSGDLKKRSPDFKKRSWDFKGCQRFRKSSGDLKKSSGDFLRLKIYSCESLHIFCTGGSKVTRQQGRGSLLAGGFTGRSASARLPPLTRGLYYFQKLSFL